MDIVIVGIGGGLGSLARFLLGKFIADKVKFSFPIATLIINITGAFLLGVCVGFKISGNMYLLAADGFLGAFTTFSTFMYEGFHLFISKKLNALIYIFGTLMLGLAFFNFGYYFKSIT